MQTSARSMLPGRQAPHPLGEGGVDRLVNSDENVLRRPALRWQWDRL